MTTRPTLPPAVLAAVVLACGGASSVAAERPSTTPLVTVTPRATEELLANPGIGWQTFHRTSKQDKSLPGWIPSTVQYARWGWGELEPAPGKLNEAFLDDVLRQSRESGQKLAFRVMCCSTTRGRPYHPAWLADVGGRVLECDYEGRTVLPIPDLDDPIVLSRHLDFIRRLGRRYDGHPDLDHVDLGSVGWWGEWHLSGSKRCKIPTLENRMAIVNAYLQAFKKTPLVMLIGGGPCLKYAVEHGTGWRADCLGDLGGFSRNWCHMRKGYLIWIKESSVENAWKTAPVAWESCWDMRRWVQEGWPLRYIFNYALALHGSQMNNKSAPLPDGPEVRPELERFLRRLGYRLVLNELRHPAQVQAGGKLALAMRWQNVGSAPCYRPYRLAFCLTGPQGRRLVAVGKTTVNRWMPGSVDIFSKAFLESPPDLPPGDVQAVTETLEVPDDLPPGRYTLAVGVVGEATDTPVLRLGIEGRDAEGWYPLSHVEVRQ
ncbi:MAG: DUF4832 domain-containing protein [Thermoguttaceae bacterium]|jgi:hypothetical protein|nr:DUF4832 domain-containing protein [Thermoguttaceae bacterium]